MPAREPSQKPKTKKAHGLRPIGGPVSEIAISLESEVSTKPKSTISRNVFSSTTRQARAERLHSQSGQITVIPRGQSGLSRKPDSLAEAQALLETAKPGQIDQALQAWLPHSVRSRVVARWLGGEHGYEVRNYELDDGFDEDDGRESLRLLEMLNARAESETCEHELARLKVLTATRNLSQADLTAQIAIYAEELTEYPIDVVREACRWWAAREKWFPSWAELRDACDERVMKRRAILVGLRRYFGA